MTPFETYFSKLLRPGVTVTPNGTSNCVVLNVDGIMVELYFELGDIVPMAYFTMPGDIPGTFKEITSADD
jgi:hypothetical protein